MAKIAEVVQVTMKTTTTVKGTVKGTVILSRKVKMKVMTEMSTMSLIELYTIIIQG
jgi:hypothetical protein